jgi:hypothetical protein
MSEIWKDYTCPVCGQGFTEQQWYVRHDGEDGDDIHEECCGECSEIWSAIRTERAYQDNKYGTAEDRRLAIVDYLHIAQGELNEAMCSFMDGDKDAALLELLQVIAVGVACLERHGVVER